MSRTLIANLGDESTFEYGGYFIWRDDETGKYEGEALFLMNDYADEEDFVWHVYQFPLDRCTFIDGVLSDNPYHSNHPTWFANSLDRIASHQGMEYHDLVRMFTSEEPIQRAIAWKMVGEYHGFYNLDEFPIDDLTREKLEERYLVWDKLK